MSITDNKNAFVDPTAVSIDLSQMFTVTAASNDPAYLVLTVLDRNEYTEGATDATGSLSGNGQTLDLSGTGGDARGTGIVFTYEASTGEYFNSTYGFLNQLTYNSSGGLDDVANLSLFGTNNLNLANANAGNAESLMQVDASGYLGSATVVTEPGSSGTVPAQATPDSIAAVADSFVGDAWNMDGCWVLASTIAAEAGASLPVQSTLIGLPGQANGEWIVAFDGPAGQTGNWQALVKAGEIIVIGTPGGGGHITTCVSGAGTTAMLVDNITYENNSGQITNLADDGSDNDVVVSAPHPASQEWAGVAASSVVIYELDTPIVSDTATSDFLASGASQGLGSLFAATDPANKSITEWQVYDTASSDALVLDGTDDSDHSAASALTVASLSSVSLLAGPTATTDTLEVRAYNGSWWGDWQSLDVNVGAKTASAPVLVTQTADQTWTEGKAVSLVLPTSTFEDPQGETLSDTATMANGQALPSWLTFNATTETFSGVAPATAQNLSIEVTATDTSGLTASETFSATVQPATMATPSRPTTPRAGITLSDPTPNQTWTEGQAVALVLPSNTFTDALGLKMSFAAYEVAGPNVTSWLHFNAATDELYGTVPATASGTIKLEVIATDAVHVMAADMFSVTFAAGSAQRAATVTAASYAPNSMPAPVNVAPAGLITLHT
jgi:hypothetical protein